jgi:hypothetical protein
MLYHRRVHWPFEPPSLPTGSPVLLYTKHAESKAERMEVKPDTIHLDKVEIFEIQTDDNGNIVKYAFRTDYNGRFDLCMVLAPVADGIANVVTMWFNEKRDKHGTLDKSRYATV